MNRDRQHAERMLETAREMSALADQGRFRVDPITTERIHLRAIFLSESADRLSPGFKSRYPSLWEMVRVFRTNVVHEYEAIDAEELWTFIRDDLPLVVRTLRTARFPKETAARARQKR